jgi:hypothetical protein
MWVWGRQLFFTINLVQIVLLQLCHFVTSCQMYHTQCVTSNTSWWLAVCTSAHSRGSVFSHFQSFFSHYRKWFHLINSVFLLMLKVSNAETSCFALTLFISHLNACEQHHNVELLTSHGLSQWPVLEGVLRMFIVWGLVWLFVWGSLWQQDNKHCDVQNFILTSLYTWHLFSRWYTSELHVVSIDFWAFFHFCAKTCILALKKYMSYVCWQEVTACIMLTSVTDCCHPYAA